MRFSRFSLPLSAALLMGTCLPVMAEPSGLTASLDAGVLNLRATETVHLGGRKVSELEWETKNAMALRGSLGLELAPGWRVKAEGRVGFEGDGYMTDYDWIWPFSRDSSKENWSSRSQHDDTRLDHYFSGSLELNRMLLDDPQQYLSAGVGFRYTDVQWSAYGGKGVYSLFSPRDLSVRFNDDVKGITYRQQIPVFYGNLAGGQRFGNWSLNAGLEGGAMVYGKATDDHHLRDMRFTDKFDVAGMFGVKAGVAYDLTQNASIYVDGAYEYTSLGRGDTHYSGAGAGNLASEKNAGGGDLQSIFVGMGVKGRF
ncbi:omptin family outer membrane protease [Agrobacterium fabrum]|uniref:omptin family outer membrane protease n=1 Tax=Agrobacterium fabrum TaxID=1176649 RepID=UPI000DD0D041|nr:omptin family outer membrane protease [Agrobacterium fabrum]UXT56867.1 omptin family outer membrane protease [Agrobacterium fabrum]CAH0159489.1 Outer membrane protease OmpP [Agrobacterium fabrum]CAH0299552.1 Outer membrane protease OmpP [Agrobacterium fabrum]